MSEYPEHDKLAAVKGSTQAAGEFLEWLLSAETPYVLAHYVEERCLPAAVSIPALLAQWQGLDRDALDREQEAILAEFRNRRDTTESGR